MSGQDDSDLPGGWEAAAAEYVLGLLPEEEARAFERRLATERDLRRDVEAWEEYFASLTDPIEAVGPPPQALRRIEAQLFGARRKPVWRQLLPYLLGAVAAAMIAWAANISGLLDLGTEPDLYADLAPVESELVMLAHWAPESGTFMVRHDAGAYPEGRSLEIWMIPTPQSAPISLGLVSREVLTSIALPPELSDQLPGAVIAISEEPEGGAPGGAPTGPIRATGTLAARD